MNKKVIRVTKLEDVPNVEHWAIFEFNSVIVSDGWGSTYGKPYLEYVAFLDRKMWLDEISRLERETNFGRVPYVAFKMPAPTKIDVKIEVEEKN